MRGMAGLAVFVFIAQAGAETIHPGDAPLPQAPLVWVRCWQNGVKIIDEKGGPLSVLAISDGQGVRFPVGETVPVQPVVIAMGETTCLYRPLDRR